MNRRDFLMASVATSLLAGCNPAAKIEQQAKVSKLGVQLFSLPKMLDKDFAGSMEMLARLGYQEIETFGPYTFSDPKQIENWKKVTPSLGFSGSGFFGHTLGEVQTIMKANGLSVPSMHTDIYTLQNAMGPLAEAAHGLGATYVTLPAIPAEFRKNLDDYRRSAELFNTIGADALKHGVRFGYHNHGYGLKAVDGKVPLDVLLSATDPASVFLEMDVFWTVAGGADPVERLSRFKGRYRMLHLKNMKSIQHFSGDGGGPDQWIPLFPYMTTLGEGAIDIKAIVAAAKANGAEHYFVEQDNADNAEQVLGKSADFWNALGK